MKPLGADGAAAQHVQQHHAGAGQNGVDHEQDGSHEQEVELDGLGDARDEGGGGGGDQDGLDLAAVLGTRGVVHGQAGADQANILEMPRASQMTDWLRTATEGSAISA